MFSIAKISQNKDTLSLVKGLVFGEKDQLNSYYVIFQQAGMVHILVASGFNVALLVDVVKPLLFFTSRITKNYLTMVVFWLYIWFIGGEPPLLRAGLMVSFYLLVLNFGLKISSRRIVFYSGTILLILKPELLKSLSFWFSFLATLGLLLFNRSFLLLFNSSKLRVTEFFSKEFYSTFSAQLLILPLVIYFFGEFNWLSFLTNTFFLFPIAWFTQVGFGYFLLLFLTKGTVFSGLLWPYSLIYSEIILLFIEIVSQVKAGYYLLFSLKPEEKTFYLLVWSLSFCLIIGFLRTKTNKKVVFLHEIV
ncbi:MAG: ComEC/Rec2 family competence protein [Candidatus Pacebacteria bacterium]|nr:ComEC/Rec2 family competence protein [Candidatus Paceibacterota bacterium]